MFLAIDPTIYPVLIAVFAIFVPVIVLSIFCFIRLIIKQSKKMRKEVKETINYEEYFGGKDNIKNIEIKDTRVCIEVKDLSIVDFDGLKSQNINQALINGNVIKFQSELLLESVKSNIKN